MTVAGPQAGRGHASWAIGPQSNSVGPWTHIGSPHWAWGAKAARGQSAWPGKWGLGAQHQAWAHEKARSLPVGL